MILVVNPNLAVDRVAVVAYRRGASLRPMRFSQWAGGSGVHASYVAHLLGQEVLVQGFAGGHSGARFRELAAQQGIATELVDIPGETRGTYSLIDAREGELCNVAEPGPPVTAEAETQLERVAVSRMVEAEMLIVSGSVPPGCSPELPARLVAAAHARGLPCIADLAGPVLLAAIPRRPWLIKPSRVELAELLPGQLLDPERVLPLAQAWVEAGVANVCVSLDAEGVIWASADGARRVVPPQVEPYNTIGCGDTFVGAVAATYAARPDLAHAIRVGTAAAAANVAYDAPGYCTEADIERLLPRTRLEGIAPPVGPAVMDAEVL